MRVLVTRPLPDAETTAADLVRRGHEPILAPMLRTQFVDWARLRQPVSCDFDPQLDAHPQGLRPPDIIVTTSLNGIRGLLGHPEIAKLRCRPIFVPGDASARLAETSGFVDVRSAHGDAADVLALIVRDTPRGSSVLYAAGQDRSGDLAADLTATGMRVDLVEVYRATAATTLPEAAAAAVKANRIDRILIFSARTGEVLVSTLDASGLLSISRTIPIHAISEQAARPLRKAGFGSIIVALRPDAAELLDTLSMKP